MTQYAPVAPLTGLARLAEAKALGHYQLLIAPIVLEREEAYRRFFAAHYDQFIIVDNGVIELGFPLPAERLYRAAGIVNADLVVMPDAIDDAFSTIRMVRTALVEYRRLDAARDTMGVVQGRTFEECVECARSLVEAGVDWLGVPRGLTPNLGSRVELVQTLGSEFGKPMHVLGFSNNIADDMMAAAAHQAVRGIDAATPVWMKAALPTLPPTDAEKTMKVGRRPRNFWESQPDGPRMIKNVQTARRWLNDAHLALTAKQGLAVHTDRPTQP